MSEPPGLSSALGIEAVEVIPEGESLTVRVTGRWRRRRPDWRGPAILVVEAHGTRHRFPAMPEPPSLSGAMPGTWRMSFSVASELAPYLAGRSWLQLGSVAAPLPVFAESTVRRSGDEPSTGESGEPPENEPGVGRPRPRQASELAVDTARRRADEAESLAAELALRVDQLERALEDARGQPARLERARRAAEQSAHAESSRRRELEEDLAEQERALEEARARAAALAQRVNELEHELRRLRRTADEAIHLAAGERAARVRAEQVALERPLPETLAPQPQSVPSDAVAERIRDERTRKLQAEHEQAMLATEAPSTDLATGGAPAGGASAGATGVPSVGEARAASFELQMRARRAVPRVAGALEVPDAVERERARRVEAEHRVAELERTLVERTTRWARAYAEIDLIRDEIGELRRVFAQIEAAPPSPVAPVPSPPVAPAPSPPVAPVPSPPAAPAPSPRAAPAPSPRAAPAPPPAGGIQPERLADALARLRMQAEEAGALAEPAEPEPAAPEPAEPEPAAPEPAEPEPAAREPVPAPPATEVPRPLNFPPPSSPRDRYAPPTTAGASSVPPPGIQWPSAPGAAPARPPVAPPASTPPPESSRPKSPPTEGPPRAVQARAAGRPGKAWLWPVFRALAREDPLAAGRLVLQLLPAWPVVRPLPVACDLILGDRKCVQVTLGAGAPEIRYAEAPRRQAEVHFQVTADLARLARTLIAGPIRRRVGRGMATVTGDREAFETLRLLVRSPLTLGQLYDAGARLDPELALTLVTRMIDPTWTVGERFTIAYQQEGAPGPSAALRVNDGTPVMVAEGPVAGPVDTTIVGPPEALLGLLAGQTAPEVTVLGDERPLALLVGWLDRAQSA